MQRLTPEQIAEKTDHKEGRANIIAINRLFRNQDKSHLFPIKSKFNVTERAIKQAREFQRMTDAVYGLEYCYLLDHLISEIVNNSENW